jgi:hypothetical protein
VSYTLQEYRDYVRAHLDVDEEDIPDVLVDTWCREATTDIARARDRWPFLEHTWTLTLAPTIDEYNFDALFDPPIEDVASVRAPDRVLQWIGSDDAERAFLTSSNVGAPLFFGWWEGKLRVFPSPLEEETVTVRGWRKVRDWVADGAGAVSDLPADFDEAIRNRILGDAYSQQEDPEMGSVYFGKAAGLVNTIEKRLGVTPSPQPIVLGGRRRQRPRGRLPFDFEV